jgi:phosphatidylglycerol:prolipoprotein diacylglycerol transferase
MHPILINLGPLPIHTYGFMIAVGFLSSVAVVQRLAVRSKMDVDRLLDLTFMCLVVGILGARTLFIITRFSYYLSNPLDIFKIWEGGLVFLGGPLAVFPFLFWYVKKHKLPIWKTMDILAPGLVTGHAIGRFGCLAAGCCYGKPTGSSWYGVRLYSDLVEKQSQGILLHPTQLYEAGALLILFLGLLAVFKYKKFDGQVALTYLLAYPIIRSIIEIYRGDLIRGFVIDDILSTSQFISILVFLAALVTLVFRLKQLGLASPLHAEHGSKPASGISKKGSKKMKVPS